MDELSAYNKERWEALAQAGVAYSQPWLDLTPELARQRLDPHDLLGEVAGKRVLCLAGGGGQQSAAFALLGARVMVYDLSETQLTRDREVAAHYGLMIETRQGDMRDLSRFADDQFDIIFHGWSLTFVPDVRPVFAAVVRVLSPGGLYTTEFANPFVVGIDEEKDWTGEGYLLKRPYRDGEELYYDDSSWRWTDEAGREQRVDGPREFRHTLSTVLNTLIGHGFHLLGLWEGPQPTDPNPAPGTWDHFITVAPPWLTIWARLERTRG